ncbi:MAG: type II toxin-antitoxin system VapC family toxin [Sphingopyxis sp.]|nr:type II toxin-antitoxin system VapC family toxin [Sphingopyxis sp.]
MLAFGATNAMLYGDVMVDALRAQHNMAMIDGQIAAIAMEHGFSLATRNTKDFVHAAISLINPWDYR